jgi:hypothetical protein
VSPPRLSFNSQEGVDSVLVYSTYWRFEDKQGKFERCEFIEHEKIECPWFSTVKEGDSTIIVSVEQNDTGYMRSQEIYVKDDSYTGSFEITQCPELIELSRDELLFGSKGGVDSITVITDKHYTLRPIPNTITEEHPGLIHFDYDPIQVYRLIRVTCDWISIDIPEEKKIIISAKKNRTGKERGFVIALYDDRCEKIKVIQSAE